LSGACVASNGANPTFFGVDVMPELVALAIDNCVMVLRPHRSERPFKVYPGLFYLIQVIPNSEGLEPARVARDDAGPRFAVHPTRAPCFLGRPSLLVAASGHPFFWWALRDPVAVGPDRDGVAVDRHGTATTRVEINQCVGCTRRFFAKSFLGDNVAAGSVER